MVNLRNTKTGRTLLLQAQLMAIVNELLASGKIATKREIYYQYEGVFRSQLELDTALDRLARTLKIPRDMLGIVAGSKGLVFGSALQLFGKSCYQAGFLDKAQAIPTKSQVQSLEGCKFVLVVEKEAVFQTILNDSEYLEANLGKFVLVTGKGYPCMATRALVSEISSFDHRIPVFALVDFDPYGLEIALQYRIGSTNLPDDSSRLACPRMIYLGLTFRDMDCYGSATSFTEPLTEADRTRLKGVKEKARLAGWTGLEASAGKMMDKGIKAEIEVISGQGNFFTRNYLVESLSKHLQN